MYSVPFVIKKKMKKEKYKISDIYAKYIVV